MGRLVKSPAVISNYSVALSARLPAGETIQRPTDPVPGQIRYNDTDTIMEYWNGTVWVQPTDSAGGMTPIVSDEFTGDGIITDFTMSVTVDLATDVMVFIGGIHQYPGTAYTVDGSTTITFTSPLPTDDIALVMHGYNLAV